MLCKQQSYRRKSLFNHSNENMSVFFVDCPKIPFWSVLSLSCCCLFKIYTSYIISKSNQPKVISVESWERLRNDYSTKPMEGKFLSSDSILSRMSLYSYFVSWKIYLFTSKKIAFKSKTEMIIPFRIFLRLRHEENVFWGGELIFAM